MTEPASIANLGAAAVMAVSAQQLADRAAVLVK